MTTAQIFNAIGTERRLKVIRSLAEGPLYAYQVQEKTGLTQPENSATLIKLARLGILKTTPVANLRKYELVSYELLNLLIIADCLNSRL